MSVRFRTITDTCGKILNRNPVGGRTVRYRTRIRICEYRIVPYCNDTLYRIGYSTSTSTVVVSDHKCFCIETCFAFLAACSVCQSSFRGLPQDMAVPSRCPRRDSPETIQNLKITVSSAEAIASSSLKLFAALQRQIILTPFRRRGAESFLQTTLILHIHFWSGRFKFTLIAGLSFCSAFCRELHL